jgi:pimeloyl-ACP methyl ester carboxylesterase
LIAVDEVSSAGADQLHRFTRESSPSMAVHEWRAPGSERLPLICLPGLTRNARDFAPLAEALVKGPHPRRILAFDARGRGQSGHDPDPADYQPLVEAQDVTQGLDEFGIRRALFLGTSRGGILTMMIAGFVPDLVAGAILNDVGTRIEPEGLVRLKAYVGIDPGFFTWGQVVAAMKFTSARSFPALDDARWERFARATFTDRNGGRPVPDYDLALARALDGVEPGMDPIDLTPAFNALLDIPVMLIRGETSELLSTDTVLAMSALHPNLTIRTVRGEGHAPLLDTPADAEAIDAFLTRLDPC